MARSLRSTGLQSTALGLKQPVSRKHISSLSFCFMGKWHTFFETSGLGLKIGRQILVFKVGLKILEPKGVGTCRKFFFWLWLWHFYVKQTPYNQFLRSFDVMWCFDLRPLPGPRGTPKSGVLRKFWSLGIKWTHPTIIL